MKHTYKLSLPLIAIGLFLTQLSFAQDPTPTPISKAEATELSVHRVERLVVTKKIERDFQLKLSSLTLESLTPASDTDPAFKITVVQPLVPGASKAETLVIYMNSQGKVLSYTVDQDGLDSTVAAYPDKDAATLLEFALHQVEKEGATMADAVAFYADLKSITLVPQVNQGRITAIVAELLSNSVNKKLNYTMSVDGTITARSIQ